MIQIIPKWKVIVAFMSTSQPRMEFYISENYLANIFSTLSKLDYGSPVSMIEIKLFQGSTGRETV